MALRGHHGHVPAARAGLLGAHPRQRPLPCHGVAFGAAPHDADRRPAQAPLRRAPRQAHRAHREGDRAHEARAALQPARAHVQRSLPLAARHLARPRGRPRARVQVAAGRGARRGHHVDGDARVLPAHGSQLGEHPRPGPRRRRSLRAALRLPPARHVARRVRLRAGHRRAAARGGHPLLLRRHARHPLRRPPPGVRRVRANLLLERRRRLRARSRVVGAGVERQGRVPGRQALPRLLPGHRLRPADGLHQAVHPPRRPPRLHGHQVPRDHARPAPRQVGLRSGHRARQGGPARVPLPRQPREAGAAPARRDGSAAHDREPLRRRALRPLVVRGPHVPRQPLQAAALRPADARDADAGRLPRAPPDEPGRDAVRVVVGPQGLQRVLAEREQRLDVPSPAHGGRAHGRARAAPPDGRPAHAAEALDETRRRASSCWRSPRTGRSS